MGSSVWRVADGVVSALGDVGGGVSPVGGEEDGGTSRS